MKLNFLYVLSLLLVSCGEDPCKGSDFNTSQGICVFTNGFNIDKDKLSYAIDVTEDVVSRRHPTKYFKGRLNDSYDNLTISFVESINDKIDGYTEYTYYPVLDDVEFKVVAENIKCENYTWIIPHEMMHVYLMDIDRARKHKKYWHVHEKFTGEENVRSIQFEIFTKLRREICE